MKLTLNKERVVLEYILELSTRGFPLRFIDVRDIANSLLAERGGIGYKQNCAATSPHISRPLSPHTFNARERTLAD